MNIPCLLANKECLPCRDDPIANLSAEAPDRDVFIGFNDYFGNPPLGKLFAQIGCKRICYSEVSQEEADDCALLQAQECVWVSWPEGPDPPVPPDPNGGGGNGTPGDIPPGLPRNAIPTFRNTEQCCVKECPDGQPFTYCQPAGTVGDLSQAVANAKALSLACKRADAQKLCFVNEPPDGVVGTAYSFQFLVVGGQQFNPLTGGGYIWNSFGVLPPGLELDGTTGVLSGTPTAAGSYSFEIDVFDARGNFATKIFDIEITDPACAATCTFGATITPPVNEPPGFTAYAANVDLVFGGAGGAGNWVGSGQVAVLHIIDPITEAIVNTISYAVDEVPQAGIYAPSTGRLVMVSTFNLGADSAVKVVNTTTGLTEDTTVIAGSISPHAVVLDTVNGRIYVGFNVGPGFNSTLYRFDLVSHVATIIATGSTTLGATAYSPDDNFIFCALDSGRISVFDAATFAEVSRITVPGGNVTSLTYCPANGCLYGNNFPLSSLIQVWKFHEAISTSTTVNFNIPAVGGQVQVDVVSTEGMVVGRLITIELANYTIISVDNATQVTVENIDGIPANLVLAGAIVSTEGIALSTSIAMGEAVSGVQFDADFGRVICHGVSETLYLIDPATQVVGCSVLIGMSMNFATNMGNSGCKLFVPTANFPAFPTIPTDNAYHTIT